MATTAASKGVKNEQNAILAFACSLAAAAIIWWLPIPALSTDGTHGLALTVMVVILWLTNAVPPGLAATLFVALVVLLGVLPSQRLLVVAWTSSNVWFAIAAFGFGIALASTKLANRITVNLLDLLSSNYLLIGIFVLVLSAFLSFIGMAGDFGRFSIIFPILIVLGKADPLSNTARTMAMLFIAVGQPALLFVLNGVWLNPAAIALSHSAPLSYFHWFLYFGMPSLACSIAAIAAVRVLSPGPLNVSDSAVKSMRVPDRLAANEWRVMAYIAAAIVLWMTGDFTHFDPGWVALLIACLMCLPKIGVISADEFFRGVNWNIVLFLAGAFALGAVMKNLGIAHWIEGLLVPASLPHNPYLLGVFVAYESLLIHLFTGDAGSAMAVTVPIFSSIAHNLGYQGYLFGWIAYAVVYTQFFFVYQQAGVLFAYAFGLFTLRDVFKLGLISAIYTPLLLALVGVAWWRVLGIL